MLSEVKSQIETLTEDRSQRLNTSKRLIDPLLVNTHSFFSRGGNTTQLRDRLNVKNPRFDEDYNSK